LASEKRNYTVLVVPDGGASARQYRVRGHAIRRILMAALAVGLLVFGAGSLGWLQYYGVVDEASEARVLREENLYLRSELRLVQDKVGHLAATLERVEALDAKLRVLTQINDPERSLAMGPLEDGGAGHWLGNEVPLLGEADGLASDTDIEILNARLDNLSADARREEASLRELHEHLIDQRDLLAAMPSIWPTRGWVTSTFGSRVDPFTGQRTMHRGLDVAAPIGTQIRAPAGGTVVFSGVQGPYGKTVVIDHGIGVKTLYSHMSEIFVRVGDTVTRRQIIGAVGNTGRSTGPHLHYEVRVNGIPEDPRKFILD
jgi:murein DD-endopeptidase MepM/ murein hydrolase activator NlpD